MAVATLVIAAGRGFRGRWSRLDDGRIRQFFEEKGEDGAWNAWFEGFYSRED